MHAHHPRQGAAPRRASLTRYCWWVLYHHSYLQYARRSLDVALRAHVGRLKLDELHQRAQPLRRRPADHGDGDVDALPRRRRVARRQALALALAAQPAAAVKVVAALASVGDQQRVRARLLRRARLVHEGDLAAVHQHDRAAHRVQHGRRAVVGHGVNELGVDVKGGRRGAAARVAAHAVAGAVRRLPHVEDAARAVRVGAALAERQALPRHQGDLDALKVARRAVLAARDGVAVRAVRVRRRHVRVPARRALRRRRAHTPPLALRLRHVLALPALVRLPPLRFQRQQTSRHRIRRLATHAHAPLRVHAQRRHGRHTAADARRRRHLQRRHRHHQQHRCAGGHQQRRGGRRRRWPRCSTASGRSAQRSASPPSPVQRHVRCRATTRPLPPVAAHRGASQAVMRPASWRAACRPRSNRPCRCAAVARPPHTARAPARRSQPFNHTKPVWS
mmetsp:Transcript_12990/g.45445  ORF Transcript_12990/g.45445 Transcript_12990/m.45445 type:complete len:449 (-) Transcript_12990:64-1410(-)